MDITTIKLIQYHFKQLTNCKISQYEVKKFILPTINYINNNKFNKFLLSGSQGSGKTTLVKIIKIILEKKYNKKVLILNLDNFYFDKEKRKKIAKLIHPLLKTRGVPGTHEINNIIRIIKKFNNNKYPFQLPVFDKLQDKRKKIKKIIHNRSDILILEGWCVGCPPLTNKYLFSNINSIEKKFDKNKKWRIYYNNLLKKNYLNLFKQFHSIIYIKAPSFTQVFQWRLKQENQLSIKTRKEKSLRMSSKEIAIFIQHYEKITKWMFKKMPNKANLVLFLNKKQKIKKIKKN